MEKNVLTNFEKYSNQIDTSRYGDYTVTDRLFCKKIQRASDMIVICIRLFKIQHK